MTVGGTVQGEQRVLRRLMTAVQGYIRHVEFGAGLPGYIGQPATTGQIQAVVLQQMELEQAVKPNPPPVVTVANNPDRSFFVTITYTDALTDTPRPLDLSCITNGAAVAVSVQTFTQFVQNQGVYIQGTCAALIDFTVSSVLRAFTEANAAQGLFLEAQALQVAALTRAAACDGSDLDTYFDSASRGCSRRSPKGSYRWPLATRRRWHRIR